MTIAAIREKRAAKVAEARSLLSAETLTDEQKTKFDALKTEITALEADEARALFVDDLERRSQGAPVDNSHNALMGRVDVLGVMRAQMEGRSLTGAAAEYHTEAERRTGRSPGQGLCLAVAWRRERWKGWLSRKGDYYG